MLGDVAPARCPLPARRAARRQSPRRWSPDPSSFRRYSSWASALARPSSVAPWRWPHVLSPMPPPWRVDLVCERRRPADQPAGELRHSRRHRAEWSIAPPRVAIRKWLSQRRAARARGLVPRAVPLDLPLRHPLMPTSGRAPREALRPTRARRSGTAFPPRCPRLPAAQGGVAGRVAGQQERWSPGSADMQLAGPSRGSPAAAERDREPDRGEQSQLASSRGMVARSADAVTGVSLGPGFIGSGWVRLLLQADRPVDAGWSVTATAASPTRPPGRSAPPGGWPRQGS